MKTKRNMLNSKNLKRWDIVELLWEDSTHESGWKSAEKYLNDNDKEKWLPHLTLGYFLQDTPKTIMVVQSKAVNGWDKDAVSVDSMMQIPKSAILRIKKLNEVPSIHRR